MIACITSKIKSQLLPQFLLIINNIWTSFAIEEKRLHLNYCMIRVPSAGCIWLVQYYTIDVKLVFDP